MSTHTEMYIHFQYSVKIPVIYFTPCMYTLEHYQSGKEWHQGSLSGPIIQYILLADPLLFFQCLSAFM